MRAPIYSWSEDCFCEGCIVYTMIQHHPWSQWAEERDPANFTTAEALADMLAYFDLADRPTSVRTAMGFPTRVARGDNTIFCATCLTLLYQAP